MSKYKLTAHKEGMRWKTPHDEQETIEGVGEAIKKLLGRGFTYITLEVASEKKDFPTKEWSA